MKTLLDWSSRISAGIGVLLITFAGLSTFTKSYIFGFESRVNYFHAANSFFLITIILYLHYLKHKTE